MKRGALAVATLLVVATVATVVLAPGPVAAAQDASDCDQRVTHDLRTNSSVATFQESGEVASRVDNTEVQVTDATGFVRLSADNPNGYCVQYHVEISPEIVEPADIGEVDAVDGPETASWRARQNLTSQELYTVVEVTVSPGQNATFAPAKARVVALSWTGDARQTGGSIWSTVTGLWSDDSDLQKREYTIEARGNSTRITVPMTSGDGRRIDSWHATYTLEGETHAVTQESDAPVFYLEEEDHVTFLFNEQNATVHFTANPGWIDQAEHSVTAYDGALSTIGDWIGGIL